MTEDGGGEGRGEAGEEVSEGIGRQGGCEVESEKGQWNKGIVEYTHCLLSVETDFPLKHKVCCLILIGLKSVAPEKILDSSQNNI